MKINFHTSFMRITCWIHLHHFWCKFRIFCFNRSKIERDEEGGDEDFTIDEQFSRDTHDRCSTTIRDTKDTHNTNTKSSIKECILYPKSVCSFPSESECTPDDDEHDGCKQGCKFYPTPLGIWMVQTEWCHEMKKWCLSKSLSTSKTICMIWMIWMIWTKI